LKYPRVLIFTASTFNPYTGTGILLTNLFKGWPIDNLALIHSDSFYHDYTLCKKVYKLRAGEYGFAWPLFASINKIFGKYVQRSKNTNYNINSNKINNPSDIKAIIRKAYKKINGVLGGQEVYLKYVASNNLLQWINMFNPQIIYCHVSSLMNLRFARELKGILKIPLSIHIMDDWINVRYQEGIFAPKLKLAFYKELESLLAETSLRMGIGQKMCDAYENKFGYSFKPFSNVVDPGLWLNHSNWKRSKDGHFLIVYAGTINSKNVSNLETISKIVEELHKEKVNCKLKIYTFHPRVESYRPLLERKPSVTLVEVPKDDEDMISLLKNSDLLFLPVDFTKESIERMRYSIFAKIPAYMMSGTPILVYGPSEVASVEYALKEKWAYVVAKKDKKALRDAIIYLASNPSLSKKLGQRAQEVGKKDFDANKVRLKFHNALAEAAHYKP